jgi:hypothetical protein
VRSRPVLAALAVPAIPVVLAAALVVGGAGPAAGDCASPMLAYPAGEVDRGDTITVTGEAFGDACHDTGPPPAGQGVLGRPLTDVEVVIAQGGTEVVVATGDADASYAFVVDVVVPAALEPGEATVHARWPGGRSPDMGAAPLVVTDAAPPDAAAPGRSGAPGSAAGAEDDGGSPLVPLAAAAAAAVAVTVTAAGAAMAVAARRRRSGGAGDQAGRS